MNSPCDNCVPGNVHCSVCSFKPKGVEATGFSVDGSDGATVTGARFLQAQEEGQGTAVIEPAEYELESTEEREVMRTGSQRNSRKGKGRFDLLWPFAIPELARHMEKGSVMHGDRNWELGQKMSRMLDSALGHIFEYMAGDTSENKLAAAAWNLMSMLDTRERVKRGILPAELDDLPPKTLQPKPTLPLTPYEEKPSAPLLLLEKNPVATQVCTDCYDLRCNRAWTEGIIEVPHYHRHRHILSDCTMGEVQHSHLHYHTCDKKVKYLEHLHDH